MSLFSNPYEKGAYGYLQARKRQQLLGCLVCACGVALFWGIGMIVYHTPKNLFALPAIFMVLPTANFFVSWVAIASYKTEKEQRYAELLPYEEAGLLLSDLAIVNEKGKRLFLGFVIVYEGGIVAYAPVLKDNYKNEFETDVILRLKKKGLPMRIKIYDDWSAFCERISRIEPQPAGDSPRIAMARDVMIAIAL